MSLPEQHGSHRGRQTGGERRRRAAGFPAGPTRAVLPALPPGLARAVLFAGDQQVTGRCRGGPGDGGLPDARRGPAGLPGPAGWRCRRAGPALTAISASSEAPRLPAALRFLRPGLPPVFAGCLQPLLAPWEVCGAPSSGLWESPRSASFHFPTIFCELPFPTPLAFVGHFCFLTFTKVEYEAFVRHHACLALPLTLIKRQGNPLRCD